MAELEAPPTTATEQRSEQLPRVGGRIYFTKETARLFAARGLKKRWNNRAPKPPPLQPAPQPVAEQQADFAQVRLARVRAQLDELDKVMQKQARRARPDSKKLKELADATARLQVQESQLAGRPGPGTLKPGAPRAREDQPRLQPPLGVMPGPRRAT